MKNYFKTSKSNKMYFVSQNEDGSLWITNDGVNSIDNAGQFILSMGGIQAVLDRCDEEITLDEFKTRVADDNAQKEAYRQYQKEHKTEIEAAKREREQAKFDERYARAEKAYNELLAASPNSVIETNYRNICIVLSMLNLQNWGSWELPTMTIGYSCNQYDCDGKQATGMILDRPIDVDGEQISKFSIGAPHGYLMKYHQCRYVG